TALDSNSAAAVSVYGNGKMIIGNNSHAPDEAKLTLVGSGTGGSLNGTGTVSVTNGSNTLTGSGTAFRTELATGDRILIAATNQSFAITAIASDTSATTNSSTPTTASGSTFTIQPAFFRVD